MTASSRAIVAAPHANGTHAAPADAHARLREAIVRFDAAARARVVAATVEVESLALTVSAHLQARAVSAVKTGIRDHAWLMLGAACFAGALLGSSSDRRRRRRRG